jgi:hypothetical protein
MKRCSEIMLRKLADYRKKIEQERANIKTFKKNLKGKLALNSVLKGQTSFESLDIEAIKQPLSYINGKKMWSNKKKQDFTYQVKDIVKFLPNEETFDVGDFPNNITEYYWIHEIDDFYGPWYMLCQIATPTGPAYAFYKAGADWDTGFDLFEYTFMSLIVSKSRENLFSKEILNF